MDSKDSAEVETDLPEEQNRNQLPLWPESIGLGERHTTHGGG